MKEAIPLPLHPHTLPRTLGGKGKTRSLPRFEIGLSIFERSVAIEQKGHILQDVSFLYPHFLENRLAYPHLRQRSSTARRRVKPS